MKEKENIQKEAQRMFTKWLNQQNSIIERKYEHRKELESDTGIRLYNLNTSVLDASNKELLNFFIRCAVSDDLFESLDIDTSDKTISQDLLKNQFVGKFNSIIFNDFPGFVSLIRKKQMEYKMLLDKAIERKEPEENDIKIIEKHYWLSYSERWVKDKRVFETIRSVGIKAIYGKAYTWLVDVWSGRSEVKRCEAEDCSNIFAPYNSGRGQRFCSSRCRIREFQRRKRLINV